MIYDLTVLIFSFFNLLSAHNCDSSIMFLLRNTILMHVLSYFNSLIFLLFLNVIHNILLADLLLLLAIWISVKWHILYFSKVNFQHYTNNAFLLKPGWIGWLVGIVGTAFSVLIRWKLSRPGPMLGNIYHHLGTFFVFASHFAVV